VAGRGGAGEQLEVGYPLDETFAVLTTARWSVGPYSADPAVRGGAIRERLEARRSETTEILDVFGRNALAVWTMVRRFADAASIRELLGPARVRQVIAYRPKPLAAWTASRRLESQTELPLRAFVSLKLRDDAVLDDGHLLPVAVAEVAGDLIGRRLGGDVVWSSWLTSGAEDVLLVLRAGSIDRVADAVRLVRSLRMQHLFGDDELGGPFSKRLREVFAVEPVPEIEEWLQSDQDDRWASAAEFIDELRLSSNLGVVIGIDSVVLSGLAATCRTLSKELPRRMSSPLERVQRLTHAALRDGSTFRGILDRAGLPLDSEERHRACVRVRVRPGREGAVEPVMRAVRRAIIEASGRSRPTDGLPTGVVGEHELIALGEDTPLSPGGVVGALALIDAVTHRDPLLRRRLSHLVYGTITSFEALPERPERTIHADAPPELHPFSELERSEDGERSFRGQLARHRPMSLEQLSLELAPWEEWRATRPRPWLPRHVHRAARRLVELFNGGLQDHSSAVYLLDLLPSLRTLVRILETGDYVVRMGTGEDWLSWEPIPSLHGGAGCRAELLERDVVRHLMEVIRLLDLGLRQRCDRPLAEIGGETSIRLQGRRHKWLSGVAALVPAVQEEALPNADEFRWPGFCLLDLVERPMEVLVPDFAVARVGPSIFEEPELLLGMYQEFGHVALRRREHASATRRVRAAVRKLAAAAGRRPRGGTSRLNRLLEEVFCDLTFLFLGLDGDLDALGRFVIRRVATLSPRLPLGQRESILERLFVVHLLLDAEGRRASEAGVADSHRPGIEQVIEVAAERFAQRLGVWLAGTSDPWRLHDTLLGTGPVSDSLAWRPLLETTADVLEILQPEVLGAFRIGRRSVLKWLLHLNRLERERICLSGGARVSVADGSTARRRILVRNLHWEHLARRQWPGLPSSPKEQVWMLEEPAFPLVVPARLAEWRRDARDLACRDRDESRDCDRLALLHGLWSAGQGLKRMQVAKARREIAAGEAGAWRPEPASRRRFLFQLFRLRLEKHA